MTKNKLQKLTSLGVASVLLGSVLAPVVASAAPASDTDTVTANVNSVITLTTSGNVEFTIIPDADGNISSASDTVAVSTNNLAGYNLTLENDSASVTSLVSAANDTFTAASSTPGALAKGTWGFAVGGLSGFDSVLGDELLNENSLQKFAGVPAKGSGWTIASTSEELQNNQTVVRYAARADSTQPQGAYTATVLYTATTK